MNDWTLICALDDIPVLGARRVARAQGLDVAIFRNAEDTVFALLDHCPHKGGPLSQGIVFASSVTCPLHNWSIGFCDGQAVAPDEGCTPVFQVRLAQGLVYLLASELQQRALDPQRPLAGPALRAAQAAVHWRGKGAALGAPAHDCSSRAAPPC